MQRKHKEQTKRMVFAALMVAISIIIGVICKAYLTLTPFVRITFDNLPILLLGYMFGPVYSVMAAVAVDLISALMAGFAPTPLITVGAGVIGLLSGVLPRYIIKRKNFLCILCVSLITHAAGSVLIKTYALSDLYTVPFFEILWVRIPVYAAVALVEAYLVYILMKNKYVTKISGNKGA